MQELERRLSREKTENIRLNNLLGEYSNASESYMKKSEALSKEYKKTFDKLKLEFRLQKDTVSILKRIASSFLWHLRVDFPKHLRELSETNVSHIYIPFP